MRAREKVASRLWLAGWRDGRSIRLGAAERDPSNSVADLMYHLVHEMGYVVMLEPHGATTIVRCYPRRDLALSHEEPVALSYNGSSVRNILDTAAVDAHHLRNYRDTAVLANREVCRWVP